MRIDYKLSDKFDFGIFIPVSLLIAIGLTAIYSSTFNHPTMSGNFNRQVVFAIASFFVFFITYSIPTNIFKTAAVPIYLFSLLLLLVVLVVGRKTSGARSWLDIGPFGFQPSEFAKIGTVLAMAAFLSRKNTDIDSFKHILLSLAIGLVPVMLILLEPDMGTAIVFLGTILILIFWKGISLFGLFIVLSPGFVAIAAIFGFYYFLAALIIVLAILILFRKDVFFSGSIFALNLGAGFFTDYLYNALSPHQQKRIQSFIDPNTDPLGAGYNTIQAKVAIGSGGLFGKGFLQGNQTQLQYIPEQWTDFIYCVIGEEFGFVGSMIVLILFVYLFLRILKIASSTKDEFLSLTITGILSIYIIHFLINVGMVVGILPVIGIPLPFVSYGGSSLLVNMFMLGIIANVYKNRKNYT
ncbi:MAG: rod shape-determining protein RodA [Ignavibacteriaceae bacterium]|nr:rod shape-determining protein RodA [Ignavibacterium sp.]MCC6255977.1 rod shape-determining protein RodA [Ignavibacteriaceae bacterium]HMN25238.1 rod shape-determining protein RodA [Ignavibacteriaceae bacterium]HRN25750.1 rod shape-determining protein RodA [Ignavibacteriaceae bacterium]HRP93379.1 rod shape-determining protein RodA [Ignavibacteriaceae bacterium]